VKIHGEKYEVTNIVDLGTRYGERALTTSRSGNEMKRIFETHWFYRHDAPHRFGAEHESCIPTLSTFLEKQYPI